ncbi:GFA family protein [Falsirhodobacter xinxiangensis]
MPFSGRCHCGGISFTVFADIPDRFMRCTCSFCSKSGALHAYFSPDEIDVRAKPDGVYRWGTHRVDHHFCSTCGCAV